MPFIADVYKAVKGKQGGDYQCTITVDENIPWNRHEYLKHVAQDYGGDFLHNVREVHHMSQLYELLTTE